MAKGQANNIVIKGLTMMEMIISLAIIAVIFAVTLPQFRNMENSWASKRATADAIQNGRILVEHLSRDLARADKITAVSDPADTTGYIEFEGNDAITYRYEIGADNIVEFGPVGTLSDLAGPVSQLQFTCYDAQNLDTPITSVEDIRSVNVQITLTNPGPGQDQTYTAQAYLRTNWNTSGGEDQVTYQEFTETIVDTNVWSITISTPGSTSGGDLLIAAVATDGGTFATISAPAGWTLIDRGTFSGVMTLGVWWKLADASESPTHQFTWASGGGQQSYGWIMRFTGHDPDNPINVWAVLSGNTSTPTSTAMKPAPSVTTTVSNTMIVRIGGFDDDDITVGDPGLAGHTSITMNESNMGTDSCSGGAGYMQQPSIGASGTCDFTLVAKEEWRTVTIAIAPAPGGGEGLRP